MTAADDDLVQFGGHQLAAAAEFFQEFVEVTFLGQDKLTFGRTGVVAHAARVRQN
jgi:hypothetical protein